MAKSGLKRVSAFFFATAAGREPVREWLKQLLRDDRREVGRSLMTLEFAWPVGMPLSRPMGNKRSRSTPKHDLELARERMREHQRSTLQ